LNFDLRASRALVLQDCTVGLGAIERVVDFKQFRGDLQAAVPRSGRVKGSSPAVDHTAGQPQREASKRTEYLIRDRLSFMRIQQKSPWHRRRHGLIRT
jgi:hypothetical protein